MKPSDYCIVAFFIVIVISVVQWFVDGRKNFKGPQIELVAENPLHPGYSSGESDDKPHGLYEANGNGINEMGGEGRKAELAGNGHVGELSGAKEPVEVGV